MSELSENPSAAKPFAGMVRVDKAEVPPHPFNLFHGISIEIATVIVFAISTVFVWIFGFTFWILLEAAANGFGWGHGRSLLLLLFTAITHQGGIPGSVDGWPIDAALFFALIATWCSLYLAFDHLALWGNLRAQQILRPQLPGDVECYFVEIRMTDKRTGIKPDLGYLYLTTTGLHFVGGQQTFSLPRHLFSGRVTIQSSFGNLMATHVLLPLISNYGTLQLLGRDTATRLSDTCRDGKRLEFALWNWLAEGRRAQS